MLLFSPCISGQNKYDSFLKQEHINPNDYLKSIFIQKDIVVICERDHAETTQYDFLYGIVTQPWFIENVGTIILETATRSIQKELDDFLINGKDTLLMEICRNNSINPLWTKTNFYYFLKKIYKLNLTLKKDQKIRVIGADIPIIWSEISNQKDLTSFQNSTSYTNRDESMAKYIINWYTGAAKTKLKNKALVIMNYRHAYGNIYWSRNSQSKTTNFYRYIKETLPKVSTNVFLNRFTYSKFLGLKKKYSKGKWDKSFLKNGNKPIGFTLKNSPFGSDQFEDYPYIKTDLKWQDVFDHFIFFNPISEFIDSFGIEGLVDNSFKPELKRRFQLFRRKLSEKKIQKINTIKTH
jgi:hypothetical protein